MRVDIQCKPSYALAYCYLEVGEKMRAESGSMVMMSAGIEVSVDAGPGGIAKGIMRKSLAGESFFMTTFTAHVHGAWVAVAPKMPGDVNEVDITDGTDLMVESGSLLAMEHGLSDDVRFAGLGNIAMHEGATMQHIHGTGKVLLSSYGGMQRFDLGPDEQIVVDTGHIIAFSASMGRSMKVGPLAGLIKAKLSGEGLVAQFTGPGMILTQTRAESAFRSWILPDHDENHGRGRRR